MKVNLVVNDLVKKIEPEDSILKKQYKIYTANIFALEPFTSRAVIAYRVAPVVATSVLTLSPADFI